LGIQLKKKTRAPACCLTAPLSEFEKPVHNQRGALRTSRTDPTPYENRTTHGPTDGPSTVWALETPPPPSGQQVLAKGIVFPEVVFPAAGLVAGERVLLPGFDFA
jgi:hypothetical protein